MKKYIEDKIHSLIKKYMTTSALSRLMRSHPIYLGNNLMLCQMVWGGWVVVPTFNIDVAVGAIRDGCIEVATTKFIQEHLNYGDCYINVGANFGYYTSLAGNIVGSKGFVYSYEANPVMFAILLRTAFYSGIIDRVKLFNRAAANTQDKVVDFFFDYQFIGGGSMMEQKIVAEEDNFLWNCSNMENLLKEDGSYTPRGLYAKVKQKTVTLDSTVDHKNIDLIQCDAEGSETYILLGAKNIIERSNKIKIVFEWSSLHYKNGDDYFKKSFRDLWNIFSNKEFSVRRIMPHLRNNEVMLSASLTFEEMTDVAEHGDYYVCK